MKNFIFDLQRFDSPFSGGTGTENAPYLISKVADLEQLATDVNGGNDYGGKYFKLTKDLDLSSIDNWTPIGDGSHPFRGKFDGDEHTIENLKIDSPLDDVGLFGCVVYGEIKNLTVEGSVTGGGSENYNYKYIGGIVGVNGLDGDYGGTIKNCTFIGEVTSKYTDRDGGCGGIAGANAGLIENCTNTASVTGNYIGGIVGLNGFEFAGYAGSYGKIKNCTNNGKITCNFESEITDNNYATRACVGGIASQNSGTIENCLNDETIECAVTVDKHKSKFYVGGIVGSNSFEVSYCLNLANVTGENFTNVDGIIAYSNNSGFPPPRVQKCSDDYTPPYRFNNTGDFTISGNGIFGSYKKAYVNPNSTFMVSGFDEVGEYIEIVGGENGESLEAIDGGFKYGSVELKGFGASVSDDSPFWVVDSKNNIAKYGTGTPGGALISSSKIVYRQASLKDTYLELDGISTTPDDINNNIVQLSKDNFAEDVEVKKNKNNYSFSLAQGNYSSYSFTGMDSTDKIKNEGSQITIDSGAGNDLIINSGDEVSINASEGNDSIENNGGTRGCW